MVTLAIRVKGLLKVGPRSILKPVSLFALSAQAKVICVPETEAAARFVGVAGTTLAKVVAGAVLE